jgi:branched-chain amino acid aminotransferase
MFDKKGYILNGQFMAYDKGTFDVLNRAFLYGDCVFETMFSGTDRIYFFEDHMNRLNEAMKVLKFNIPILFSDGTQQLQSEALRLIMKNGIFGNARLRLTVFRKSGGFYTPQTNDVDYILTAEPLKYSCYVLNKQGLTCDLFEEIRKPANLFSPYKISNSILYTMSGIYNKSKQMDESFILNEAGNIIESTSSNVFIVINDEIITPPVSDGCIAGIMRKQIIRMAEKHSIQITRKPILKEDVLRAEEVFLSNAIKGIQWVVAYKQRRYYKKLSEFLIGKINEELRDQ